MINALLVLLIGAALTAAAAFWALRAYRREGGRPSPSIAMVCGAVGLIALGTYLTIGRPELPGGSYAGRLEALKQRDPTTYTLGETLAVFAEAAREHPDDPLPLLYTGQLLLSQDRPREAAQAFDDALRREPQLAEAMLGLGRAMVRIDDGRVSADALALFQQASVLTDDPAPWIYQAMAAMQEGRADEARQFWAEAVSRMAPDDPMRDRETMFTETVQ